MIHNQFLFITTTYEKINKLIEKNLDNYSLLENIRISIKNCDSYVKYIESLINTYFYNYFVHNLICKILHQICHTISISTYIINGKIYNKTLYQRCS